MKKLLLCLFLTPTITFAQKIPNHSNVIYISSITKNQLKDSLTRLGFTIVDHDSTSFITLPRQYKILDHGQLVIQVKALDTSLKITGIYNLIAGDAILAPYGNRWRQAERTWIESIQKEAFLILNDLSMRMPGKVSYAKEKLPAIEVKEIPRAM